MSLSTTFPSVVSSVMATTSAASVSAPPQTFVAFCVFALACLALVVLAYRRYAAPGTSYYVLAATLLGWWLASLIVFVIPMVRCSKPKTKDRFLCVFPSLIFSLCVFFKKKKSKKKNQKNKKKDVASSAFVACLRQPEPKDAVCRALLSNPPILSFLDPGKVSSWNFCVFFFKKKKKN